MVRPKLILDTNVCGKLLTPAYRSDLEHIRSRMGRRYQIVVSPQTFIELLDAMKGGDGSHFDTDRERLRLMAGGGRPRFLKFPGAFALRSVLGLPSTVTKFDPDDFEKWLRIVFRARNRKELFEGLVEHPLNRRKTYGFNADVIANQQGEGKVAHKRDLEAVQNLGISELVGLPWANGIGQAVGHTLTLEQAKVLLAGLDAAFKYDSELFRVASKGTYNFDKHAGDWIDWQQLFYLCDPQIYLLTDDADIKKRVGDSTQRDRILLLREFLETHGFTAQH